MTNAERQEEFRRRHPDYYRLYQAKRRAAIKAHAAQRELLAKREVLALPAPVETIEIPGMTTIGNSEAVAAHL